MHWEEARRLAATFEPLDAVSATPDAALGSVLAGPLRAMADMPAYDTALTDGWAIAGPGPWRIRAPRKRDLFAGLTYHESTDHALLRDGQATPVASGDALGSGVTGVVSGNRVRVDGDLLKLNETSRIPANYIEPGTGIRARGSDAGVGSALLKPGERVTPAIAALAAAAGNDEIPIIPMPVIGLTRVGDEVLDHGIPRSGLTRDAVGPGLPGWIAAINGRCQPARVVTTSDADLIDEIDDLICDVVVTAGAASDGAVRRVLAGMKAEILVDEVACQPGGSMLLAHLQDGRPLIHCGGTPADAVAALLTLLAPMIAALTGLPDPQTRARLEDAVPGDRIKTFLLPVRASDDHGQGVKQIRPGGPGGLFALAQASGLGVIPPGGVRPNMSISILPL